MSIHSVLGRLVRYDSGMLHISSSVRVVLMTSFLSLTAALPLVSLAATGNLSTAQGILISLETFFQRILLPFLFSVAFLYFIINIARYFILEGGKTESHAKARQQAIYGIAAFVFLFILWGIVTMILNGLQIGNASAQCPDFVTQFGGACY